MTTSLKNIAINNFKAVSEIEIEFGDKSINLIGATGVFKEKSEYYITTEGG